MLIRLELIIIDEIDIQVRQFRIGATQGETPLNQTQCLHILCINATAISGFYLGNSTIYFIRCNSLLFMMLL
jgi:hypothetical protein